MATARFWRLLNVMPRQGSRLSLSLLRLIQFMGDGVAPQMVDAGATLGSSYPPLQGQLDMLSAEAPGDEVVFDASAGLTFTWELPSAAEATDVRLGAGALAVEMMLMPDLQWSADGVTWNTVARKANVRLGWSGLRTTSDTYAAQQYSVISRANIAQRIHFGATGAHELHRARAASLDVEDGGTGVLYGTVSKNAANTKVPVWRRVRLHDQRSGRLIRETWSDPVTGAYTFSEIKLGPEYCAIAFDHERQMYAVAADGQLAGEAAQ